MAPAQKQKTTKNGRPRGTQQNVPGIQRALMIRPGVNLQKLNRYVPFGRDFCRCGTETSAGRICNAVIKNSPRSLGSHISSRHTGDSPYNEGQARVDWECQCSPGRKFRNFHSLVAHIRGKDHKYRGSSLMFKHIKDKKMRVRKDNTVIVPNDEGEFDDDDLMEECGDAMPALPKERDGEDDDDSNGFGGGHGFGLGQAQAIEAGN